MSDNYYEIKMLRLKMIYLLAGWGILVFSGLFFFYFLDILNQRIHLFYILGVPDIYVMGLLWIAFFVMLLFPVYILVFCNWIHLRFWESWGLSIVFMIVTFLSISTFILITEGPPTIPLEYYSLQYFLSSFTFVWGMLSVCQILILLPVFTIGYFIWGFCLKKWESYTSLTKRTRTFLYLLNLLLILGIGCTIYIGSQLD
ncbi:MAG: hypothetical protein IJU47_04730 [Verrucomicrobia bacterium]|nr:hypothetical protein [Verrucomicrobiota bacterium]